MVSFCSLSQLVDLAGLHCPLAMEIKYEFKSSRKNASVGRQRNPSIMTDDSGCVMNFPEIIQAARVVSL